MRTMLKNPLTRMLYFCWKYFNFKMALVFGATFILMYIFMTVASSAGMDGLKPNTSRIINNSLTELGFIDFMLNIYNQLTYYIQVITGLDATVSFLLSIVLFGVVCSFSIGLLVWFSFEVTYFIKVFILKENKQTVLEDLSERIEKSMKENNIK